MADIKVETIVDEDAAVAKVTVKMQGLEGVYTGSSKRHPKDNINGAIGETLAVARAFHKATTCLMAWADKEVELEAFYMEAAAMPFFKEPEANAVSR